MSPLWMSIDPDHDETRLMLTEARVGAALRARLPPVPRQPRALAQLLEALSAWYGMPLTAVIDAGAEGALHHPQRWAQLLGEIDGEQVRVEWVVVPARTERRDRFLGELGDFSAAKRLLTFAATGQR
jgi:hypothetical protein